MNKDQKLLHQLGFSDEQVLTVKTSGSGTPSGSSADSSTSSSSSSSGVFSSSYAMEQVLNDTFLFKKQELNNLCLFAFSPYRFRCLCPFHSDKPWLLKTISLRSAGLQLGEDACFTDLLNTGSSESQSFCLAAACCSSHTSLFTSSLTFPLLGHSH